DHFSFRKRALVTHLHSQLPDREGQRPPCRRDPSERRVHDDLAVAEDGTLSHRPRGSLLIQSSSLSPSPSLSTAGEGDSCTRSCSGSAGCPDRVGVSGRPTAVSAVAVGPATGSVLHGSLLVLADFRWRAPNRRPLSQQSVRLPYQSLAGGRRLSLPFGVRYG
ncbi:hypothetical protein PENTCL1PPCAC_8711, partial [Pristionchus entomophagus]